MRVSVLNNFWLKLSALALALLVWLHVATERSYTNDISLPLAGASLREGLTLTEPIYERVTITVRGTGKELLRARIHENALRLNITQLRTGEHSVELTPELLTFVDDPHGLEIARVVAPSTLTIGVSERVTRSVPVEADFINDTAQSVQVAGTPTLEPSRINITGPKPRVDTMRVIVTEPISLAGLHDSVKRIVSFNRQEYRGLRMVPDSIRVECRLEPVARRLFPRLAIALVNANEPSARIEPKTLDIEIEGGEVETASLLERRIIIVADRRNLNPESKLIPLRIDLPKGIRLRAQSADSVRFFSASDS